MGRFLISCCCICGTKAGSYDDPEWEMSDFCPKHAKQYPELTTYKGTKLLATDKTNTNILSLEQIKLLYNFMNDGIIELSKREKHTIQRAIKHGEYNNGQQELFNDLRDRYIKQN